MLSKHSAELRRRAPLSDTLHLLEISVAIFLRGLLIGEQTIPTIRIHIAYLLRLKHQSMSMAVEVSEANIKGLIVGLLIAIVPTGC